MWRWPLATSAGVLFISKVPIQASALNRITAKFLTAISGYAALVLENARKVETLKNENSRLLDAIQLKHDIVGRSKAIQDLEFAIRKLACADATVLIIGESGTGKELTAKALHMNSARSSKPFEVINCALLRGELLEAELFGHEKGAFTGACVKKVGKLEAANGGTVFLDEFLLNSRCQRRPCCAVRSAGAGIHTRWWDRPR